MNKNLKNGMVSVLIASLINLIFSLATNFVLPKYLSVDSYAIIKTFQLYASYAGVISFGYVDGMYLKYGGRDIEHINKAELSKNLSTMRIFQLMTVVIVVLISVTAQNIMILCFALSILPLNMAAYFTSLYKAIGEFNKYGRIMNMSSILTFFVNMGLLLIFRIDYYLFYMIAYIIVYLLIWIILEYYFQLNFDYKANYLQFSIKELLSNTKSGIILMIGNYSSIILTSIDRFFVKALMDNYVFAEYSFAVSMVNFMSIAITPITVTLYNYFCKVKVVIKIKKIRNYVTVFAIIIIASAFPGKFILEVYLTKYINASNIIFLLFASQIFFVPVKGVYVNLYKAYGNEKKYSLQLALTIGVGFILNIVCYKIYPKKEVFAFGTLLASIFWFILCLPSFKWLKYSVREISLPFIILIVFLFCGFKFNAICGLLVYSCSAIAIIFFLLPDTAKEMYNLLLSKVKNYYKKIIIKEETKP